MIRLILKAGRDAAVRRRHPWLFSGAVDRVEPDTGGGSDGLAAVFSASGERLAAGAYSPESQIVARLWSFGQEGDPGPDLFRERFATARILRDRIVPAQTTGYRAVHSEGDRCPGVVLDVYAGTGVLDLSTEGTQLWEAPLAQAAKAAFGLDRLVVRKTGSDRDRGRRPSPTEPDSEPPAGASADGSARVAFRELGLTFFADVLSGQKTGFFLDQRENRARARALAGGRRVLNLFAYSGGFSVAALAGGAQRSVDVEASEPALALAAEHRRANGFPAEPADLVRTDVFEDLRRRVAAGESWDLVVCDPPAFAKKKGDVDRAARGYKDVNRLAMRLVAPGGMLLTCSCSGLVDATLFQQIVFAAEMESGASFSLFARQGAGADHPVSVDCPEGEYLKGMWLIRTR